ncbi:xylosidase/arabinosidase [Verticillium alfalfae VaMs.102]|uniref:Xylosidase/arabinosidase n=1 Tax=Verticillium alfalfae (strain VaMs.102 / ATCC MYA-4576 / FGSC 10136) TaxID=526221 RepID=C9SEK7_VERA1|nr:xylosidase/arabinosidase [Verticillium alfalfae VaMs.102]EEY16600.1 xylosidase/arabinosidase [Verticillium alfalfae VaMs.102]
MGSFSRAIEYSNPIVPGFSPDPSVVFVDGTFFLCTSSFHVFPGLPIYASRDLKGWTHIGNALNRQSQLSLKKAGTIHVTLDTGFPLVGTLGIVAPSIHYHKGIFYIVTTNTDHSGPYHCANFIISTENIWSNKWSDPVYFDFNGIDTSLFFDDNDRVYVQGSWMLRRDKQPTANIKQSKSRSPRARSFQKPKKSGLGGPNTIRKARTSTSAETNPIMTADGKDEYIQNIGHGDLFQDYDGRWWAAVLGVRKQEDGNLGLSRESFLSTVNWPSGDWPVVRQPRMNFTREASLSMVSHSPLTAPPFVEDLYIRDYDPSKYRHTDDGKTITLTPSRTDFTSPVDTCTFLGRRQRSLDSIASTRITVIEGPLGKNVQAGLALYKDPIRSAYIAFDFATNSLVYSIHNSASGLRGRISRNIIGKVEEAELRISAAPLRYSYAAKIRLAEPGRGSEKDWFEVGSMESLALDARDFTGPILGVFAHAGDGEAEAAEVTFKGFDFLG